MFFNDIGMEFLWFRTFWSQFKFFKTKTIHCYNSSNMINFKWHAYGVLIKGVECKNFKTQSV